MYFPCRQPRDGSIDSREGSVSPTRRRKKARRMSTDGSPSLTLPPPNDNAQGNGDDQPQCKEEVQRDGVEDLTLDEEADDQPAVAHNDVVRSEYLHTPIALGKTNISHQLSSRTPTYKELLASFSS